MIHSERRISNEERVVYTTHSTGISMNIGHSDPRTSSKRLTPMYAGCQREDRLVHTWLQMAHFMPPNAVRRNRQETATTDETLASRFYHIQVNMRRSTPDKQHMCCLVGGNRCRTSTLRLLRPPIYRTATHLGGSCPKTSE